MAYQLCAGQRTVQDAVRPWLQAFLIDASRMSVPGSVPGSAPIGAADVGIPDAGQSGAEGPDADLAIVLDRLFTERDEVLTGMLPHTHQVTAAIRAGTVQILGRDGEWPRMQDALDLLCIISTHNRIARSREMRMRAPGFWIRGEQGRVQPVMPILHLELLSGCSGADLRQLLSLLARDGAIRILQGPDGVAGVRLVEGYVDDREVRRFLRC